MSLGLYMDVHVPRAITDALRARGIDVLTAQDDGTTRDPDSDLIDRATALGRIVYSQDADFLREAHRRQRAGITFSGVIYAHQNWLSIGERVRELETIGTTLEPDEVADRVLFLPYQPPPKG